MRLLFAGTPETALPVLAAIDASDHELVAVLTRPDARRGRGRALHPSPVSTWAQERGVRALKPPTLREAAAAREIAELGVDAAVVVAYGALVPKDLLDVPTHGWLNLHYSLLPSWRGAAPVQHALRHGDTETGASVFRLEEGLDTGPVFASVTEPIGHSDTSGDLLERLSERGATLMISVLDSLADGTASTTPQPEEGVSLAPKIEAAQGRVDFRAPAEEVDRLVRAVSPAPGAWTTDPRGARLKLGPLTVVAPEDGPDDGLGRDAGQDAGQFTRDRLAPGQVHPGRRRVLVGTGQGAVALGRVAPAGKSWMDADAWARGARLEPGDRLGLEPEEER